MDSDIYGLDDDMYKKRAVIGKAFSLGVMSFCSVYGYEQQYLDSFKEALDMADDVLEHSSSEDAQQILGGEFDIIGMSSSVPEGLSTRQVVPLYLMIDLISGAIDAKNQKIENKDELLEKMTSVRDKLAKLNFSSDFKPEEKLSREVIRDVIEADADFTLSVEEKEGIRYVAFNTTVVSAPMIHKNGDIYSAGPVSRRETKVYPLYESDRNKILDIEYEKSKKRLDDLKEVTNKYFRDGKIPELRQITDGSGLSPEMTGQIDPRIVESLRDISYKKSKYFLESELDLADRTARDVENIRQLEKKIEEEKRLSEEKEKQERLEAIKNAKERYDSKSAFWKFVNKARLTFGSQKAEETPDKVNFEELKTDEINDLYSEEKGRGK